MFFSGSALAQSCSLTSKNASSLSSLRRLPLLLALLAGPRALALAALALLLYCSEVTPAPARIAIRALVFHLVPEYP